MRKYHIHDLFGELLRVLVNGCTAIFMDGGRSVMNVIQTL